MTTPIRAEVSQGKLEGVLEGDIAIFRGIPFGEPPVGPLRWKAPVTASAWSGVRPALDFAPAPLQPTPPTNAVMYRTNFDDGRALRISEDCLYLNVWSPDPSPGADLPVMVWVHGGGNRYGYGSQLIHDGRNLARHGVVIVTLNHRLGSLGFLAHPELSAENENGASGNYGLLDIVAALDWVQENIRAFGGDPSKVTLAGNSAGAAHITHLMASPLAQGRFRAVIGQSASGIYRAEGLTPTLETAQAQGEKYAQDFGGSAEALRRASGIDLIVKGHFGPIVDGYSIPVQTQEMFDQGKQAHVPALLGFNTDEGSVYARRESIPELLALLEKIPDHEFATAYPAASVEEARNSARLFVGESRFTYPVWKWAETHVATSHCPTWLYRFADVPRLPADIAPAPDGIPGYGAYHTAELPFVWDNLALRDWAWTEAEHALAHEVSTAWMNFVTSLNPNSPNGVDHDWPEFSGGQAAVERVFGTNDSVERIYRLNALTALDGLPRPY